MAGREGEANEWVTAPLDEGTPGGRGGGPAEEAIEDQAADLLITFSRMMRVPRDGETYRPLCGH